MDERVSAFIPPIQKIKAEFRARFAKLDCDPAIRRNVYRLGRLDPVVAFGLAPQISSA
jgi:hypothetical protein